ncbi:MAG: lactate racemase domain-containing protein [Brevinema sp.]
MIELIHEQGIEYSDLENYLDKFIKKYITPSIKKILIIPPDYTRGYSRAGIITTILYKKLHSDMMINIIPALGTHMPMTNEELDLMFTNTIPKSCFLVHDWREGTISIGKIPKEVVKDISQGFFDEDIEIEVNRELIEGRYDLIISIGQVVPHEVVGMANYTKNVFVGCGGRQMINKTHMTSAVCGMEQAMGKDFAPARLLYDYTEQHFTQQMPLVYLLTVVSSLGDKLLGVFESKARDRVAFEKAVALSQKHNITYSPKSFKKIVAFLDEQEFKTTWVGNKAIYRSRMLIADGGELIILAPGVRQFGENDEINQLIQKYGYRGRENILKFYDNYSQDKPSYMVGAHLIHGSSDGRFSITYAVQHLSKEEIENVGFTYLSLEQAYKKYKLETLSPGVNILEDGEEIYYIPNPALGLWVSEDRK